jgi:pSer/pThr/pTyr-binding forkhead associated (FHA) protein
MNYLNSGGSIMVKIIRSKQGALLLTLLLTFIFVVSAAAQSGLTFFVSEVNADAFPRVSFHLRAVELGNQVVSSLNASTLAVYENGEQVSDLEATPQDDGAITYVFVIDQGYAANYLNFQLNNIRQVISTLVSGGYFVDGRDTVLVLGRQNINTDQTVTLLPATQDAAELTTWVANFNFDRSTRATKGLLAVEDAIQNLNELIEVPGSQTTAIIFITRYIEDPSTTVAPTSALNTASEARNNYTSIYVFQTDPSQYRKDALQILADGSDGQYAGLTRSNFLNAATTVYQAIDAKRAYYTIAYRSPIADSGAREITINTPGRPNTGVFGQYEVSVQAPVVSISEPVVGSTIRREASVEGDDEVPTFDINQVRVTTDVTWSDGYPRNLTSATLTVNGLLEQTIDVPSGQSQLEFSWDLSDITTEGTNNIELEVSVEDELGLLASDSTQVNVEVIVPESRGAAIRPTLTTISIATICLGIAVVLGLVGGGYYLYRRQVISLGPKTTPDELEPLATIMADDTPEYVLATLTILEGPSGLIGEPFKISSFVTTLGRDPNQADIAFYPDEQSSVSRVHCRIELGDDNAFRVLDLNSSSGTRLNGRALKPEMSVVLADNDEIVLGSLTHRGVKMRFNLPTEESSSPVLGEADDRTHLVSDLNIDFGDSSPEEE